MTQGTLNGVGQTLPEELIPQVEPALTGSASKGKTKQLVSHKEALKFVLDQLGECVRPKRVAQLVKERFGIEIKRRAIENYQITEPWATEVQKRRLHIGRRVADLPLTQNRQRISCYLHSLENEVPKIEDVTKRVAERRKILEAIRREMDGVEGNEVKKQFIRTQINDNRVAVGQVTIFSDDAIKAIMAAQQEGDRIFLEGEKLKEVQQVVDTGAGALPGITHDSGGGNSG